MAPRGDDDGRLAAEVSAYVAMVKIHLVSGTQRKLSKALELLDREVVAYNTKEYWIDVRIAVAERAQALLKASGIDVEISPPSEERDEPLLAQILTDVRTVVRQMDPSKAPSFASIILMRINAIEGRLKRLEKKLSRSD